jgi:S-adenosyl-L-methionine hydrolase (adenosine-forming)
MKLVTFLSDFGTGDGYVARVKGMMFSINPHLRMVDISHSVRPYQIGQAAYILASSYADFPRDTIHLAVVDPGVGSKRLPLIVKTSRYYLVGPDNGLFTYILQKEAYKAYKIDLRRLLQQHLPLRVSPTFHGRDLFGPVAALLSKGTVLSSLGEPLRQTPCMLNDPVIGNAQSIQAQVILIDYFGNIVTSCSQHQLKQCGKRKIQSIKIKDTVLSAMHMHSTYSDVPAGSLLVLWNSAGFLEIAINQGNAARSLDCMNGAEQVEIILE